jgi:hypothetical protein
MRWLRAESQLFQRFVGVLGGEYVVTDPWKTNENGAPLEPGEAEAGEGADDLRQTLSTQEINHFGIKDIGESELA